MPRLGGIMPLERRWGAVVGIAGQQTACELVTGFGPTNTRPSWANQTKRGEVKRHETTKTS